MATSRKKLVLIDSYALIHRAFHAFSRAGLSTPTGEPTGAVYGFAVMLLNILTKLKPDYIVATFDTAAPTFRHAEYVEYKATRVKAPDELYSQIPRVFELVETFNIPVFVLDGYEADDIIGTLAHQAPGDIDTYIATGDMDSLQLVNDHTFVYAPGKSFADTIVYTPDTVREKKGLDPSQIIDFKGLRGDASDNIPGVPGIGEVTAKKLLAEYNSLENIYKNVEKISGRTGSLLVEHKASALQSKRLATIETSVDISLDLDAAEAQKFDANKVRALFGELGFRSLVNKIPNGTLTESSQASFFEQAPKTKSGRKNPTEKLDADLEPVLRRMEKAGILLDTSLLTKLNQQALTRATELKKKIFSKAGLEFNLNSPGQLAEVLFNVMKLPTAGVAKTKSSYSTAVSELEKLADKSPIIKYILEYRQLEKLRGTYLEPLPKMADKNGRVHTTYAQDTSTGRLSSRDPNLQNIPIRSDFGAEIRKAFVAPKGFRLVSADYSQIELRVVASLAQDENMLSVFKRGEDIHSAVAAGVNKVPLNKVTKEMRRDAKVINFGIIYGVSPWGLAARTDMSVIEATDYIDHYFELYPGVKKYMEDIVSFAKENGYVQTLLGRKRFVPEINSKNPGLRNAAARAAINMPIQGTAADIIKAAMIEVDRKLSGVSPQARLLLQVHDELIVEAPTQDAKKVAALVKKTMEEAANLDVPIEVSVGIGKNWGEAK